MPSSLISSLAVLLGAAALVSAMPVPEPELERRDISDDLLATFNLAEQFAAAAYCPTNNNSSGTKLTCSSGNCPLVEEADTITVSEFENSLITDVTGYVATDSTNSLIIVAFRGSTSLRNFLADADFPVEDVDICDGCTADSGFWTSWTEARDGVLAAVKEAADANPSYQIIAVGHSLGGAIADFAAAELRNSEYAVTLYTFGSPRIGGTAISKYITNQGSNYRITHTNDIVPHLPPIALDFVHISPEYWITTANDVTVTTADIDGPLDGSINLNGNTGELVTSVDAHSFYFNNISACYPDGTIELRKRAEGGSGPTKVLL